MRLLCIEKFYGWSCNRHKFVNKPLPIVLETYTAIDHKPGYYRLLEFGKDWYKESKFIPLSEIDETQLVNDKTELA